jgi:hypothetical protein
VRDTRYAIRLAPCLRVATSQSRFLREAGGGRREAESLLPDAGGGKREAEHHDITTLLVSRADFAACGGEQTPVGPPPQVGTPTPLRPSARHGDHDITTFTVAMTAMLSRASGTSHFQARPWS